ncbi:MAG: sulfatase [Planctomycetota bacterium]
MLDLHAEEHFALKDLLMKFALALVLVIAAASAAIADSPDRPNILFCIADDASYPHMSAYGCEWVTTPGFDRVANEGLLFTRAYTPNAKCAPSRACILTGRHSWQLEEAANHWCFFPKKFTTYAESLAKHDYFVGYTAKGWAPGVALDAEGNKRLMTGKPFNRRKAKPPAKFVSGNDYAGNLEDFLAACPKEQPWCFWYGSTEPHRRYEYQAGAKKGGKSTTDIDKVPGYWPDNEVIRNDMLDYAFEIEHFDMHLERMLNLLDEKGQLDNTLVVVTSDNGMPFPRAKGQEYEISNHLPLAIMWPHGIKNPGRTIDDYVSFIDFAPTFMEAAGVPWENSGMQPTSGKSLFAVFGDSTSDGSPHRDHVLIGKERHDIGRPDDWGYPIRGIVKNNMLFLENFETERWPAGNPETGYLNTDGSPTKTEILNLMRSGSDNSYWRLAFGKRTSREMYDLDSDPECLKNLIDLPEQAKIASELRSQLIAELESEGDPRVVDKGFVFDQYKYAEPGGVNYFERHQRGEKLNSGWVNETDFEPGSVDLSISDEELAKQLIGSWQIIDAHRDGQPSKIHYGIVTIKHITPTQFTWLSYKPDDRKTFRSMGGSWEVSDGKYIERPLYGMQDNFIETRYGRSAEIECVIEDDVFTQTIVAENGSRFVEIWHRIEPGAEPVSAKKSN